MYNLEFYEDRRGYVDITHYLDELNNRANSSKDARINWHKMLEYMAALEEKGTSLGEPFVKHLEEDIWELRPLNNRILFFFWKDDTYVLLHRFVKKTNKTPKREIEMAKRKRDDWLERKGK